MRIWAPDKKDDKIECRRRVGTQGSFDMTPEESVRWSDHEQGTVSNQ